MKTSTSFYLVVPLIFIFSISLFGNNNPTSKFFPADIKEGLIGQNANIALDNPKDNIFHVQLEQALTGKEKIWLVYDLYGVHNHTAVSRSINDQTSIGGYLVKSSTEWTQQKEQINSRWLEDGNNVIRFTIHKTAKFSYKVRNVGILIEQAPNDNYQQESPIVINQPQNLEYFNNKAYIKGFINNLDAQLFIDNKPVPTFAGEFECLVEKPETNLANEWSASLKINSPDGTVIEKTLNFNQNTSADFISPLLSNTTYKEKIISSNTAQSLEFEGATLRFEAGCLEKETVISIRGLRYVDIPPLDPGMVNVTKDFSGYRMLPDGAKFNNTVQIDLTYDDALIPRGYTKADVKTYFFNETNRKWVVLSRDSSQTEGKISSLTSHFTDFINGVIKVPESPQTSAYTPTSIKDIKAADPSAGINLMQAPVPNNMGTANIQHPIIIPPGRNGMQPNIALTYNSGADNSSWCGMGWDLSIPNISIDTRWGVPRYDQQRETEIYLLNGQQLKPANELMVHRDELKARNNNNSVKIFYPRVEGAFQKIVRFGDHPKEYTWEVIDKNGTSNFYGGVRSKVVETSVLRDAKRNIAHWALYETKDLNKNFVRYHCKVVEDRGVSDSNASMGQQIYIDSITYTGTGTQEGKYSITFDRDREQIQRKQPGTVSLRVDKTINARLGFKRVTADLLKRITVLLGTDTIRSCAIAYEEGPFFKTRIKSITDFDATNQEFVKHEMGYYDEVLDNNGEYSPYKNISVQSITDKIEGGLESPISNKETALIRGAFSTNKSFGAAITIGPDDMMPISKRKTYGGNFSDGSSEAEGLNTLVDITGDGLPDKVFKDGDFLCFLPGSIDISGEVFAFGLKDTIIGINNFSKSKTNNNSFGIEGHPGIFFIGGNTSRSETITEIYFSDFNGDGLIDINNGGIVYFNTRDTSNNNKVTFIQDSRISESTVFAGANINSTIISIDSLEQDTLIDEFPLHDVVRLWVAPYTDTISIDAIPEVVGNPNTYPADGVLVSIQHNDTAKWKDTLRVGANEPLSKTPLNVTDIPVNKGDKIFFRVQSIFDGAHDQVKWNPLIKYKNRPGNKLVIDANNKKAYEFNSSEDYLLAGTSTVAMPFSGQIIIEGDFTKLQTSDNIQIEILRGGQLLKSFPFDWDQSGNFPINYSPTVSANDQYEFVIKSKSNIDWSAINWNPRVYYISSPDLTPDLVDPNNPAIEFFPAVDYQFYNAELVPSRIWTPSERGMLRIQPSLGISQAFLQSNSLELTVKRINELVCQQTIDITNASIPNFLPLDCDTVEAGENLYIEYHTRDSLFAEGFSNHSVILSINNGNQQTLSNIGLHTFSPNLANQFGHNYRNWGQFAYNGNRTRADEAIKLEELFIEFDDSSLPASGNEPTNNGEITIDPTKSNFIYMIPNGKRKAWVGQDEFTYFSQDTISSSRLGKDNIKLSFDLDFGTATTNGLIAPKKIDQSKSKGAAASVSPGVLGFGANASWGKSNTKLDVVDFNGDRYPDVVSTDNIQFTNMRGGFVDSLFEHGLGNHFSKSNAFGASNNGSISEAVSIISKAIKAKNKDSAANAGKAAKRGVGISVGADVGINNDGAEHSWMDINGDGLPDKVYANSEEVQLNLGYSFTPKEKWKSFNTIRKGSSTDKSIGASFNFANQSITAGLGVSSSDNSAAEILQDVNGDGLVDILTITCTLTPLINCETTVRFNTGNGFETPIVWDGITSLDKGTSTGESLNGAFTYCISIPIVSIKICLNPNIGGGQSISRQHTKITDIDGDGFPDFIESNNSQDLTIKKSTIGRTNKLKSITRPLGSSIALGYQRVGNTYDLPHTVWALNEIKIYDGFDNDGADTLLTKVDYKNGFYQRNERDFYGFDTVMVHQHNTIGTKDLYRTNLQVFENRNYYQKGLKIRDILQDGQGNKFTETIMRYDWNNVRTGQALAPNLRNSDAFAAFPAMVEMRQNFYEGQDSIGKTTNMVYGFDRYGNVETYTDFGESSTPNDDYRTQITYHDITNNHIVGIPETMVIDDNNGNILRNRTTAIDPSNGNIRQINQYLANDTSAQFNFDYFPNGNLQLVTRPNNVNGERFSYAYEYDSQVAIYPTKITDSFGYESTSNYDLRFGKDTLSYDINEQPIHTKLDAIGRMIQITGPYEYGSDTAFTIKSEYYPHETIPWALTQHFDPEYPTDPIETTTFIDGLGRVLQVKKDATIYNPITDLEEEKMIISGRLQFDAFGRNISSRYPVEEPQGQQGIFNPLADGIQATTSEYDVLDRTTKIILPDNATTETVYSFGNDRNSIQQFSTTLTDANGITKITFADVRGRITSTLDPLNIWTSFEYNRINELTKVIDDHQNEIISKYDNLGRRTERIHPDAGKTTFKFDLASNLIEKQTANIRAENPDTAIVYKYEFERLIGIDYPLSNMTTVGELNYNYNVTYDYGEANDAIDKAKNRMGRIKFQGDGTGTQIMDYGPLGEMVKNIRSISAVPGRPVRTYTTRWRYDTWNRVQGIVYPDADILDYAYNRGGLLNGMTSHKFGADYEYIKRLSYDKFEQRVRLTYGNDTETTYAYEPDRRRLQFMTASTAFGRKMMDNVYTYDKVTNIKTIQNQALKPDLDRMGGPTEYTFDYDDMYRLTHATGCWRNKRNIQRYDLSMEYNTIHDITKKTQIHQRRQKDVGQDEQEDDCYGVYSDWVRSPSTHYTHSYTYNSDQPHAALTIGPDSLKYDGNGNFLAKENIFSGGNRRDITWDEEDRMLVLNDEQRIHLYRYDATGERIVKRASIAQFMDINGERVVSNDNFGDYTVYVNPYMVVSERGYTKHYFIENQRISTKLGLGGPFGLGADWGNWELWTDWDNWDNWANTNDFDEWILGNEDWRNGDPDWNDWSNNREFFQYFFHPDHLGSSSYVSDAYGEAHQHVEYLPFGETFVQEHKNLDRTPYLFNSKELDEETGLYYYGARYYNPKISRWLSVDPLAENAPSWTPYRYSFNNPIVFVDPNGKQEKNITTTSNYNDLENKYGPLQGTGTNSDGSEGFETETGQKISQSTQNTQPRPQYEPGSGAVESVCLLCWLPIGRVLGGGAKVVGGALRARKAARAARAVNVSKGGVKFSKSATEAANRLGFDPLDIAIKKGVADIPIIYTETLKRSDILTVAQGLISAGASSIRINTGPIINGRLSTLIQKLYDAGKTFNGFNITKTGNPKNMFILTKNL